MLPGVLQMAADLARRNLPFALVHLVRVKGSSPGKAGFLMLVTPGATAGTIGGGDAERQMITQARQALAEGCSRTVHYELSRKPGNLVRSLCGGTNEVFIEVFMPRPCLLLLGGGHVARAAAQLCALLDYPYAVVDDRPEFARAENFPGALEVVCSRPGPYLARAELPAFSHVIGLGYDAEFDLEGLIAALNRLGPAVSLGAIGSKAKYLQMTEIAHGRGVSPQAWERVKCPVGLGIGAQTPAEIAVAILADVVAGLPGRESQGWK
ncbi:MAG: XdhC family protein [Planctomycetes bacterium]|jgi:xanthine dehydrogenase accessory factor|nr:XdhC family protein [Planctomycetota bacterium]MCL4729454.1 XdhC family protein [Planctomycetota bacterium]